MPVPARIAALLFAALAAVITVLTVAPRATATARAAWHDARPRANAGGDNAPTATPAPVAVGLPAPTGLGQGWAARLAGHAQVVIASGADWNAPHAVVTEWQRTPGGWVQLDTWSGWNGRDGWTTTPAEGRAQSPVGAFSLTDAGGYAPDPGSRLPYDHNRRSYSLIVNGVRAFNHVIAINYNRIPGTAPANQTRPIGYAAGGGFWIHTQHNSGTDGCVGIPDAGVVELQKTLDPAAKPLIIMGPAAVLAN